MLISVAEPGVATAVGYNLMAGHRAQIVPRVRRVTKIGIAGSTNPGDGSVDLFYGDVYIGTFFNSRAGANTFPNQDDMQPVTSQWALEPNEPLNLLISDAFAGNVARIQMEIQEF